MEYLPAARRFFLCMWDPHRGSSSLQSTPDACQLDCKSNVAFHGEYQFIP